MTNPRLVDESCREALCHAVAALDAAELSGRPFDMSQALALVARSYRALQLPASAEASFEAALRWARVGGSNDAAVDLLCELTETAASLAELCEAEQPSASHAARERARDHAFDAVAWAGRVADPAWEVKVLLRISAVLERCGDLDDAVQLQTRAMRLMSGKLASAADASLLPSLGRLADA